jgi:hypothetical protein
VLVHADTRIYAKIRKHDETALQEYDAAPGRPSKSCDNPMVGKGTISQELLKIQLVAFLLAQGNYS